MVLVPADPKKTKAAQESLAAMRAKMKKDFEDQWARLTPDEQTAMRKQWKVIAVWSGSAWSGFAFRLRLG